MKMKYVFLFVGAVAILLLSVMWIYFAWSASSIILASGFVDPQLPYYVGSALRCTVILAIISIPYRMVVE